MGATPENDADWEREVLQSDTPVLVDFWAEWCGPCRMVSPIVDQIADEHGARIKVLKMDVDANPSTARSLGIMSIPTLIVFDGGRDAKRMVGAKGKAQLEAELATWIA